MKVPLSWLRQYVDVDLSVEDLVDLMGRSGLEVEEVRRPGAGTSGVRTAKVVHREPHPNADKLQFVRVSDGQTETEVVCGAWNFEVGDVVAHAAPGATLPGGMTLERRKIRGITSNGMICSAKELEVGEDHSGIMVLAADTDLGVDLHEVLPLGDPVIDIAVMADRGDHHSILGVARDVAAILDVPLRQPDVPAPAAGGPVPVTIEASDGCSHFVAWAIRGVTLGPSPWWLRQRLEQCGIRAINNVVDVTNYVMLELGQPLHAFDLDTLRGPEIRVRWADDGERFVTLDDKERTLKATDLVVADADRAVGLAGVMGGAETEVGDQTVNVLIEGAIWDPLTIRRTSRRLGLVSEASIRFERRVDPDGAWRAVGRAIDLLADLSGGQPGGAQEDGEPTWDRGPVPLDTAWSSRFLALDDLDQSAQAELLRRASCEVDVGEHGHLTVVAPSWRGDLKRPADLAEEVARLHGYDNIPATLPKVRTRGQLTSAQKAERRIREAALAGGFSEVQTKPFVGGDVMEGVVPSDGRVDLANPLAKDEGGLRPSLVEGLLGVVRRNVGQGRPGVAVFEIGRIFRPVGDPLEASLKSFGLEWRWHGPDGDVLPTQPRTLGIAAQGRRLGEGWLDTEDAWSVYDVLAVFDEVVARVAPPDDPTWRLEREPTERPGLHPGRTAAVLLHGTEIGIVGQLHPSESVERDLPEPVVLGELLLEPLMEHLADEVPPVTAAELVTHPAMTVDVALVADVDVPYARLEHAVRNGAGELLDELWWFDEYRGEQLGEGRRSVAIRLRLQAPDRQLTDEDADRVIERVAAAAEEVGASLRR